MGVFCSKMAVVDRSPSEITLQNGFGGQYAFPYETHGKGQGIYKTLPREEPKKQLSEDPYPFAAMDGFGIIESRAVEPKLSRASSQKSKTTMEKPTASGKSGTTKVSEVSSLLGRAGTVGLGKAVNMLDIVGSSMTNLNSGSGFVSGVISKGNKISILAFEVANTIVKGSNLMQSLSRKNIKHLKEVVLPSEGVQCLVSKDMVELLRIAAADKREELKVFSGEIIRFGNRCKDPQWHNLERYFDKLESDLTPQQKLKETASEEMEYLMALVHYTAELYHELHALDKYEQDYRRKLQEEKNLVAAQRGDNLQILRQELKSQQKHVKNLKKKSLWTRNLEEVMMKLVDIVHFLHLEIHRAFGSADGDKPVEGSISGQQRLGPTGLALHYANIIIQVDTLVSRSISVPPNNRDALYQGLPPGIKSALRSKLQSFQVKEELTVPQIKAEMEKTLQWLVPIANNTTRVHHGFGWVGEWANTGIEMNRRLPGHTDLIKIETLHHADKDKTDAYILDLVLWLHHLITHSRPGNTAIRSPNKSPIRSPKKKRSPVSSPMNKSASPSSKLTPEEQEMLRDVDFRRRTLGRSKSQEFEIGGARLRKDDRLSKSSSHCPRNEISKEFSLMRRQSVAPVIDFDIDRIKVLDIIDRVDSLSNL
ncbi:unnamed protein product [Musa acuminata subsp. malaccensis]|uniref:(wild Malaysian banana) hypothetical protein n=1 Tax=Musa acuminata subsp. malaccensis TaxID=214687 RepID=A0A804KHB0_MUSAM|nr:PREDICTED: uncharacterized protein LOC103997435 [Musa acuminata subsp. malaccensis]XP_018674137.1 PREDICTED: uncharacterized protein LOC103997435 [Musa acuminata subsp. malaccensis]CAG1834557.1 unnamed protein product [Musa acuminata subsp. malaccensis]